MIMRIVIAGGHGKIALRLAEQLAKRGDQPVGLVRNPEHVTDLRATGAEAVVCDLERAGEWEVADLLRNADAVVFAAGAGPGSGAVRKDAVDKGASVLLADAAERAGARRFVQISSMGAGQPIASGVDDVWAAYIRAKTEAELDLRARDLDWTVLRPGRLTDEPGTGLVTLSTPPVPRGAVSRDDVAAVIVALLSEPATSRLTVELVGGETPIDEAVAHVRRPASGK
jgi:uncharacterized protein YbjT (DUF2867 family)